LAVVALRLLKETPRDNSSIVDRGRFFIISCFPTCQCLRVLILFLPTHHALTYSAKALKVTLRQFQVPLPPLLEVEQRRGGRHPAHTTHLFPGAHSRPCFRPSIFTAPPQVAPKLCTNDTKLENLIRIAHNTSRSSSVNDLSSYFGFK
jgi:hypothetical protein